MTGKGKRKRAGRRAHGGDQKRQKIIGPYNDKDPIVKHALLVQYYPQVSSLREYLLASLPSVSKIRRKKISVIGGKAEDKESDRKLGRFLDGTLIGVYQHGQYSRDEKRKQLISFSPKLDESTSFANLSTVGIYSQAEIIDFCIYVMFLKKPKSKHLLCQGFQKDATMRHETRGERATSNIPSLISIHPNHHVTCMKSWPWPQVLALFGNQGEMMMVDLILECGIFVPVENTYGSYNQLSGQPLSELQTREQVKSRSSNEKQAKSPSSINFVRNRMLYARAPMNQKGNVHFGLRHNHLMNRRPLLAKPSPGKDHNYVPERSTVEVLMYIFPRQFGLHNVFTMEIDSRTTTQAFLDYTVRDNEIGEKFGLDKMAKIPKRLRGEAVQLAKQLQINHRRCPYNILLEYYCPVNGQHLMLPEPTQCSDESMNFRTQVTAMSATSKVSSLATLPPRKPSIFDHATPTAMVSAFCRAVLNRLIPLHFLGRGVSAAKNRKILNQNVETFVHLQRFANVSLHHVSQGLKISDIDWLGPIKANGGKLAHSDTRKRWEIFHELFYYIFDSLLIPLIRANFHVTESNVHGSRLFYFRHDVWRTLAEPALFCLKSTMFKEIRLDQAMEILGGRTLGYSHVRLVPKETGVRPIMNLRRRPVKPGPKKELGSSINSTLAPVYNVLSLEKSLHPDRLGSTMFSTGDLYQKLKIFKSQLSSTDCLYFAKVDVQAAFDTIPQTAVINLLFDVPSETEYQISKHVQIKPSDIYREEGQGKPISRWVALAKPLGDFNTFQENLENHVAVGRNNTIFVENVVSKFTSKDEILDLLAEHVERNLVKIGKKFYRQEEGIPQGSVVSSLLCNYFYADLEAKHLSFLQDKNTLLLRLIDDFLLITTNRGHAKRFLQTMHDGVPEYGVRVNPEKTLVNFEITINDKKVPRMVDQRAFPYCGTFINTKTLDITRDRDRRKNKAIVDSLTVEFSRMPGRMFHRKMLNTFKLQAHAMFLDTSFNSMKTVLSNVYSAFMESATKLWIYAKYLPVGKQPGTELLLKTIKDLIELAFVLMKSKGKNKKNVGYKFGLSKVQVEWLAMNAFLVVLRKRQSKYGKVLEWLEARMKVCRGKEAEMCQKMQGIVRIEESSD